MLRITYPNNFPHMGFALGVIHVQKGWKGEIKFDNQYHFKSTSKATSTLQEEEC